MIVPGFIVNRIYKKGSLKNEYSYYSFSFVNTIAKGKVILTSPTSFTLISPLASLEFSSFPTLLIDGKETFFDESLHECVSTVWDTERGDYEINEVLKLGYIYKGKVERTAQVVVVKNKEDIEWEE